MHTDLLHHLSRTITARRPTGMALALAAMCARTTNTPLDGHVSRWRVNAGQQVTAGTQVGDMGKTGCSTGSHLHVRVRLNGLDRNPMNVIAK